MMKFSNIVCLSFVVFFSLSAAAQQDERDKKYTPPENSYLGAKGLSTSSNSGNSGSSDAYRISRSTTFEIMALTRGALAVGQDFRIGKSRLGISTNIGINVFTDYVQNLKVDISDSEYGYINYETLSLSSIIREGRKSSGQGLWFQCGLTYDLKENNTAIEFGFRIIKSALNVDGAFLTDYFGASSNSINTLYNIPLRTFTPYIAFKQIDTKATSKFIMNYRVGLGVRFYRFETYRAEYSDVPFQDQTVSMVKLNGNFSEGPRLAVILTMGIGSGKKMDQ